MAAGDQPERQPTAWGAMGQPTAEAMVAWTPTSREPGETGTDADLLNAPAEANSGGGTDELWSDTLITPVTFSPSALANCLALAWASRTAAARALASRPLVSVRFSETPSTV